MIKPSMKSTKEINKQISVNQDINNDNNYRKETEDVELRF